MIISRPRGTSQLRSEDNQVLVGLRSLLTGYLSAASVDATLSTSLRELGLDAAGVGAEKLPSLVERVMLGLRMFCDPERLPERMLDLAEYCDAVES